MKDGKNGCVILQRIIEKRKNDDGDQCRKEPVQDFGGKVRIIPDVCPADHAGDLGMDGKAVPSDDQADNGQFIKNRDGRVDGTGNLRTDGDFKQPG